MKNALLLLVVVLWPTMGFGKGYAVVVSVTGKATANGKTVNAGMELAPGETITAKDNSVVQVLRNMNLVVALCGKGSLKLISDDAHFVYDGGDTVYMAGMDGVLETPNGLLSLKAEGGEVLFHKGHFFVISGKVHQTPKTAKKPKVSPNSLPTSRPGSLPTSLAKVDVENGPFPGILRRCLSYAAPKAWVPKKNWVSPKQVEKAKKRIEERLKTEREMASCGCTESSGPAAGPNSGQGPAVDPLEKRNATVRIRVKGIPRRISH